MPTLGRKQKEKVRFSCDSMVGAAMGGAKPEATMQQTVTVIVFFAIGNISLNYFNSWALGHTDRPGFPWEGGRGGFQFPFFYGMFHAAATGVAALVLMLTCRKPPPGGLPHLPQFAAYAWQLLPMGALTVINNGCNNWSLSLVALVINQVIKVTAPLPTAIFEYLLQKITYNAQIYASCCLLVVGAVMAVYANMAEQGSADAVEVSVLGIVVCVISLFAASLKPVIIKIIVSGGSGLQGKATLTAEQALFWDSVVAFCLYFIVWLSVGPEREGSVSYLTGHTSNPNSGAVGVGIILFGSTLAFGFNIATTYFIMYTSALSSTIGSLGVKIIILTASGITARMSSPVAWLGIGVAILAIILYSVFSFQFAEAKKAKALAGAATGTTIEDGKKAPLIKDEKTPLVKS